MPRTVTRECKRCGRSFTRPMWRKPKFCSRECGRQAHLPDHPIIDGNKLCRQCHIIKAHTDFSLLPTGKPAARCKDCISSYHRGFRVDPANRETIRQRNIQQSKIARRWWINLPFEKKQEIYERERARYWALRLEVLALYGGQCACCDESNPKFLTFDHMNNDGSKDRRKTGGYGYGGNVRGWMNKLKKEYPVTGIQVLCWNCNCARQMNSGVCPHIDKEQTIPIPLRMLRQPEVLQ